MFSQAHLNWLQWTFPIAVTIHNAEEWIWLPAWAAAHSSQLPWHLWPAYFRVGLLIVTGAAYYITWLSVKADRSGIWTVRRRIRVRDPDTRRNHRRQPVCRWFAFLAQRARMRVGEKERKTPKS